MKEKDEIPKSVIQAIMEDEEDFPEISTRKYVPGTEALALKETLGRLVQAYVPEEARRTRLMTVLSWFPAVKLEEYLILALEYATDKTMPDRTSATWWDRPEAIANHVRWHIRRRVRKRGCGLCYRPDKGA